MIQNELAEIHRRIDGMPGATLPARHRLDALRRETALVRLTAWSAPDEAGDRLAQLKTRLAVAEHSSAAEAADDWNAFAAAVERELEGWDLYLERLQTTIAPWPRAARELAEDEIAELRRRRIEVGDRLAQAREYADATWRQQRSVVTEAREALERRANDLSFADREELGVEAGARS